MHGPGTGELKKHEHLLVQIHLKLNANHKCFANAGQRCQRYNGMSPAVVLTICTIWQCRGRKCRVVTHLI